jgi:hypothetical protein
VVKLGEELLGNCRSMPLAVMLDFAEELNLPLRFFTT